MTDIKICGIKDAESLKKTIESGARFIGLVFYPDSSRYVEPEQARLLSRMAPTGVRMVGLFVNPDDSWLSHVLGIVPLDMIQLHGSEPTVRVAEIKSKYNLPIIKAIPLAKKEDLEKVDTYIQVADWLLFDTKSENTTDHGGTGRTFDWAILKNRKFSKPWMLSGGLHAGNVAEALSTLQPDAVDVSSGVESERGVKDPLKIAEFIQTVKNL
ncbi:MAG TPA: phosphoribosylanthranilate isomerase [Alphaproteobacteria bacterium]|nr:phosphoribosylanthranilate isomerase [Alphaproteobacteria bacterium]HNS44134.1 phosphoribosylanthranilate isomerase [Alphaproteobacteria bacterium]